MIDLRGGPAPSARTALTAVTLLLVAALLPTTPPWIAPLSAQEVAPGEGGSARVATTPHFAFHSAFEMNLNDALIAAGAVEAAGESEGDEPAAGAPDAACLEGLPRSHSSAWEQAVDWYAEVVSPSSWQGREQWSLRMELAGLWEERDEEAAPFLEIAEAIRRAAAPAYRACAWPAQDAANRAWVERILAELEVYEEELGARLIELFGTDWRGLPIRVDLLPAVLPHGANSFAGPPHLQVASTVSDQDALEILFHEGSHTLFLSTDPVRQALATAAEARGIELPRDLWHPVMFHLTGEAVREARAANGEPGYEPYIERYDLWRGRWGAWEEAITTAWAGYLAGERTLEEAAEETVRRVGEAMGGEGEQ